MRDAFYVVRRAKAPEDAKTFSETFSNKDYWIEMYCPECKEVHSGIEKYEKHSKYNYDVLQGITCSNCNTFFGEDRILRLFYKNLNIDHVSSEVYDNGDKIAISSFFNIYNIFRGRLVVKNINARLVLNIRTGQSYFLSPIDTKTKKPYVGYVAEEKITYAKIKNITFDHLPEFFHFIPDDLKEKIKNAIYDKIEDYHGFKIHPDKKDSFGLGEIILTNRFPRFSRQSTNIIESVFVRYINNGGYRTHRFLSKIKPYHDEEDFSRIMLKLFNIPHKRKLIKIITKDWSQAANYHHIRAWGIENYDNIVRILENKGFYTRSFHEISSIIRVKNIQTKHYTKEAFFIRKMLSLNSENKIVNMIVKYPGMFFDSANMYYELLNFIENAEGSDNDAFAAKKLIEDDKLYKKKLADIHDDIMYAHMKLKEKSIPIKYTPKEMNLQCEIDGYKFFLPKDTGEIRLIGLKMKHCVGSYANRVLNKEALIVGIKDQKEEYKVCIELSRDGKSLIQSKKKFNAPTTGELAEVVVKWLKMNKIKDCSHDIRLEGGYN